MIEIEEIREFTACRVETKPFDVYIRYSPQQWNIVLDDESDVPVWESTALELEEAYQKYKTALHE